MSILQCLEFIQDVIWTIIANPTKVGHIKRHADYQCLITYYILSVTSMLDNLNFDDYFPFRFRLILTFV